MTALDALRRELPYTKRIGADIPEDLHKLMRKRLVDLGMTMQDWIIQQMTLEVEIKKLKKVEE